MIKTATIHSLTTDSVSYNLEQVDGSNNVKFTFQGNAGAVVEFMTTMINPLNKVYSKDDACQDWSDFTAQVETKFAEYVGKHFPGLEHQYGLEPLGANKK